MIYGGSSLPWIPRVGVEYKKVFWAVVVVKWSACSPSALTIRVQILLTPTVFL